MSEPIEVEVLEVDGEAPRPHESAPDSFQNGSWQSLQGRVRQLDPRWWPLWVVLGVIGIALILTVGVVLGAVFLMARAIFSLIRGVLRLFLGGVSDTSLR